MSLRFEICWLYVFPFSTMFEECADSLSCNDDNGPSWWTTDVLFASKVEGEQSTEEEDGWDSIC